MKTKRMISSLLLVSALVFAGCGDNISTDDMTEVSSEMSTETVMSETRVTDDLPSELDFAGREFRIFSSVDGNVDSATFHASMLAEATGDILDDAIYNRNRAVMERFNITFTEEQRNFGESVSVIRNCVSAGDDVYDIVSLTDRDALHLAAAGMLIYMDEIPYIDLEKPYWSESLNESMSYKGRYVLAYNDSSLTAYDFTHLLTFNKQMAENFGLQSLYDLVENGTWTLDKFGEYSSIVGADLNGDTKYDKEDRYGFVSFAKYIAPCFWIGSGCLSIEKNSDDIPEFSMHNERMLSVLKKAYDLTWGNTSWYVQTGSDAYFDGYNLFANNHALFANANFGTLFGGTYREMITDYGILPYPKYDQNQEQYYSRVEGGFPYSVPVTSKDTEFVGAVIEALACESHNLVIPAYYEIALKTKFTRDDQSARVLDLIMSNRIYDLGDTFFCSYIRDGFVYKAFNNGKTVAASDIESNRTAVEEVINNMTEAITEK